MIKLAPSSKMGEEDDDDREAILDGGGNSNDNGEVHTDDVTDAVIGDGGEIADS